MRSPTRIHGASGLSTPMGTALAVASAALLSACGGGSGNPDPPFEPLVQITEPTGARVDTGGQEYFPLAANDVVSYQLNDSDGTQGTATRSVIGAVDASGAPLFDVIETDSEGLRDVRRFSIVESLAERRLRQLDPLFAEQDAPGMYAAIPWMDRNVEPFFAAGGARTHLAQGDAGADFDGDGQSDSFYFEWTQVFVGFESLQVLGELRQVAHFRNDYVYAIRGTEQQGDAIQYSSADAYYAPDIGLVRRLNDGQVQDGYIVRTAYEIMATSATVGGINYTTPAP